MSAVLLILRRCALRHWRLALRQQIALMLILALGSSVYLAVRLASNAALSGFETFTDGITRQPDWTVQAVSGALREDDVREMREVLGHRPVSLLPVVEETVTPADEGGNGEIGSRATWRLLGVDFVALLNLRGEAPAGLGANLQAVRSGVYVSPKLGVKVGDELRLIVDDRVITLTVAGVVPETPGVPSLPKHLLLMDLPGAQSVLMRGDKVDRVEVLAHDSALFPQLREETGESLKSRWQVTGGANRRQLAGTMTQAFRLNLTILSLLALLVGGYLIFQALDGVVLRRREEIGILKSLGVTDRAIQMAFLIEAGLLGLCGGALGVLLGWFGAQGAVGGVTKTMNALYGATSEQQAALSWSEALLALSISILASLIAAWWPARMAARTPPAQMLGRHATPFEGGTVWRVEWIGWALMLAAVLLAQLPVLRLASGTRLPLAGYAAALLWLVGAGLVAGAMLRGMGRMGRMSGAVARVALSHLRRPTVRHRFAVAALASAVAMTTGMSVMVASFDHTMRGWIDRTMKADIYVSSAGAQSASSTHLISSKTVETLGKEPEVAELAFVQARTLLWSGGEVLILGVDPVFARKHGLYAWVEAPKRGEWWKADDGITPAIMSESWSERFGTQVGDVIELVGRKVRVVAMNAEYGNERGSLTLPASAFREWFETDEAWRVAIMLKPNVDAEAMRDRMQRQQPGLSVFTNAHLRSEALRIFRQTFAVTHALEVIGVIVAVAGLGLALASLMLERRAILATLRSLGMTRRELAKSAALEGLGVACAGAFTGIVAGLWLGWLLVYRINKQCFGWTLQFHAVWWHLAVLAAAVIAVGVLVAALVGRWAAMLPAEHTEE
ncbi:MAG: FtsX-like permease family protein [Prosthecobacter sp.]|jgi:putative ABC transport system permease protein|uniref:FtsX-like permease family protein n=1 Tax=Prosthecobacter sp. TaxID=1965333 RepID=UPI001A07D65C|nr:FtsX-like permease family protein [Prosthecobacter sp.]MBE2283766.1 FtsX-like permease family protein [Prosthecobacter sp.]